MKRFWALAAFFLLPAACIGTALGEEGDAGFSPASIPIQIYKQTLSRADGDRCVMYPSCTAYAEQAVERFGWLRGSIIACDRLIRCGRDETRRVVPVWVNGRRRFPDPVPEKWFGDAPFGDYAWPSSAAGGE